MKNLTIEIQTLTGCKRLSRAEILREASIMINECSDEQLNHLGFKEYGENINIQILETEQGITHTK